MKTNPFKTFKTPFAISKYHVSLTKKELNSFEKEVKNIQTMLNDHEGRDLGLGADALTCISHIMNVIAGDKKKKFKTYRGIMFCFGLFISKVIISKHGGVLIKDSIYGEIDVLVPHGNSGAYRIFSPLRIINDLFDGSGGDINTYLELVDCIMELSPSEIISDLISNKK